MLANTDALGTYSSHYRDQQTGWPVSIQKHPNVTVLDWASASQVAAGNSPKAPAYKADMLQNCFNNNVVSSCKTAWYGTGNPYVWDDAHQPSGAYLPYMVTGDYYYMSELAFGASFNELVSNEAYRGFSKGLIDASHGQVRGKAWVLREMADAAWLLPDSHPLQAEFTADVENSLADWNAKYTNNPNANPLGLMAGGTAYSMNGGTANAMAPWQHNFLTWSAGHAAELGFTGAAGFRNWLAKFEIGLVTDWQTQTAQGYCWLQASAYSLQVKDSRGNWLPSYTAVYAANWPTLPALACNSPAMLTELAKVTSQPRQAGEMSGYPYSNTGFPANFQIGIAAAVDSGLPNAHAAWNLFDSRSVKPSGNNAYNDYPNFAVVPRSVSQPLGNAQPPVNPLPPVTPPTPAAPPSPVKPPAVAQPPALPPPVSTAQVSQTLTASKTVVTVGETFTVSGTLSYKTGMTMPVTGYRLYGFNSKILSTPNGYTPRFVATAVGTTQIKNDNSGVTGIVNITVVPVKPSSAVNPTQVSQTLTASKRVITVGDTFTVSGTLNYKSGVSTPVTAYRLYGFNAKILNTPNSY
ncbi:MAG: hypothetical protein ABI142_04040, partial [Bryocella sp.]